MENTKDYADEVLQKIDDDLQDSDQSILKLKNNKDVTANTTGKSLEYGKVVGTLKKPGVSKEGYIIMIGAKKTT